MLTTDRPSASAAAGDREAPCAGEDAAERAAETAGKEADRADGESAAEETLCGPQAPGEWKVRQDTSGGAGLPERALITAAAETSGMPTVNGTWVKEGPDNVGGRVVGLAVDPTQTGTVYLASASGGVWKSTDSASTFQQSWPSSFPQAIGAIATGADGAVYVGTGEANPGGGSITYEGDGVYRSTDGGRTWTNVGLVHSSTVGAIAVDPFHPERLFVAATGSLFRTGDERGVYRSDDGGQTWQLVLSGATPTTGAIDVQIDPNDPNRVYAAMWDRFRDPNIRHYAGVGSGLYRSTDGGNTWTRLDNVTALTPGDTVGLRSDPTLGRIGIGLAGGVLSGTPSRVYVTTATSGTGDEKGFYVSTDGGDSFTTGTLSGAGGAMWWTGRVWVDPANDQHVFVAGVSLRESFDGGQTWASTGPLHADHHAMVWDPKEFGRVYEGNDGGVYTSLHNGANGSWTEATVEPWSQFYSVAVSEQDPTRIAGGLQDNGSQRTWGGTRWNAYGGGDGEQNLIDPADQNVVFNCSQFGSCRRSADGGSTFVRPTGVVADRFNWFAPMEFADGNPDVVYFAGNRVNRSVDGGLTFQPMSPDLSAGPGHDEVYPFGTVTTVWAARSDPRVIWAGTDDGRVWVARDGGKTWTMVLSNQPWVTRVKVDPSSAGVAFVTLSGYRAGTQDGHVLMTTNFGRSWSDITQNLPQAPVNDIVLTPDDRLLVATDVGVFFAKSARSKWQRLGTDLPLAPVTDIQYNAASDTVYAATFGRGVYHFSVNVGGMG